MMTPDMTGIKPRLHRARPSPRRAGALATPCVSGDLTGPPEPARQALRAPGPARDRPHRLPPAAPVCLPATSGGRPGAVPTGTPHHLPKENPCPLPLPFTPS
jgi:hypothetical protein